MNSIVSGTAIEPIMQRMSSVEDDHASVVSNDEESSRDRDDDEEEEERERDQDPSEKPDEEVMVAASGDVVLVQNANNSNNNHSAAVQVVSPIGGGGDGSVAEMDSPMVVVDENEVEQVATGSDSQDGLLHHPSDSLMTSSAPVDVSSGVAESAIAATSRIFEQARVEIARLSAAVDELSRRRSSTQAVQSATMAAAMPPSASEPVSAGVGAIRARNNTPQSTSRFFPYQLPSSRAQQGSTTSTFSPSVSGGQQQQQQRPTPPVISGISQQQLQQQQQGQRRRPTPPTAVASPSAVATSRSTSSSGTAAQRQQQQQQGNNAPQQVIRSAIVGNRTIITTKTPSKFPFSAELKQAGAAILGDRYILLDLCDGTSLYKCIDVKTKEEFVCKIANNPCTSLLEAHFRLDSHPHINPFRKVVHGAQHTYLLFEPSQGDLHSYVRIRKRLREAEAKRLFRQMCETVKACHDKGIVLRDLKLRKFIFADEEKTQLRLESLEDAVVLENPRDDLLQDKRGCPAYVSPEILKANTTYSGKAADMWSLGVILYTMLVGRYPFNDSEHASLFAKISRGHFHVPECLSSKARCVIRALLRKHPEERITSEDLLHHPWLTKENFRETVRSCSDQMVPMCVPKRKRDALDAAEDMNEEEEEEDEDEDREVDEEEVDVPRSVQEVVAATEGPDGVPVMVGAPLLSSARLGGAGGNGGGGDTTASTTSATFVSFMEWLQTREDRLPSQSVDL